MGILHHKFANNVHLVKITGPLNQSQAVEVRQCFDRLVAQHVPRLIVDLEDVPFIDSHGLSALVSGYKSFGSQPENFVLAGLQDQPKLLFELTMFDHIFQLHDTVTAALPASRAQTLPPRRIPVVRRQPVPVLA